ncbi:hypothetical protein RJ639_001909 [Escallonia herrerae]|uniref:Transposase MuDR plant domain-containing protein n=1 Tax=Escallonia herrerae TaxID=1293975 RepID=A0AA88XBW3_9ASTE|nr:hypothetical protein RJ639_001909 [Escallonia herrerae]
MKVDSSIRSLANLLRQTEIGGRITNFVVRKINCFVRAERESFILLRNVNELKALKHLAPVTYALGCCLLEDDLRLSSSSLLYYVIPGVSFDHGLRSITDDRGVADMVVLGNVLRIEYGDNGDVDDGMAVGGGDITEAEAVVNVEGNADESVNEDVNECVNEGVNEEVTEGVTEGDEAELENEGLTEAEGVNEGVTEGDEAELENKRLTEVEGVNEGETEDDEAELENEGLTKAEAVNEKEIEDDDSEEVNVDDEDVVIEDEGPDPPELHEGLERRHEDDDIFKGPESGDRWDVNVDKRGEQWYSDGDDSDELRSLVGSESDEDLAPRYPEFNEKTSWEGETCPDLFVGMKFSNPQVFRQALKLHCVRGYDFVYKKNENRRITDVCKYWDKEHGECQWRVHASPIGGEQTFQIKTMFQIHTCGRDFDNHLVNSRYIAEHYLEKFGDDPQNKNPSVIYKIRGGHNA